MVRKAATKSAPAQGESQPALTIDEIREKLRSLPEKNALGTMSKLDIVNDLRPEIVNLRSKGYDWEEIQKQFASMGIKIALNSLKAYMHEHRKSKKTKEAEAQAAAGDAIEELPPHRTTLRGRSAPKDAGRRPTSKSKGRQATVAKGSHT